MNRDHFATFELHGLTFAAYTAHDDSMGRPWEEHCDHGPVREARGESHYSRRPVKAPGERFLSWDRGHGFAYDWQGAMKKARAEGWGLSDKARAELIARTAFKAARAELRKRGKLAYDTWGNAAELAPQFTREPTRGEIAAEAVRLDFDRLRGWLNDDWCWVGVIVELLDTDGDGTDEEESLWGIESDSPEYHGEVARDLAAQLIDRLNLKNKRCKTFKRESAARSEVIRARD